MVTLLTSVLLILLVSFFLKLIYDTKRIVHPRLDTVIIVQDYDLVEKHIEKLIEYIYRKLVKYIKAIKVIISILHDKSQQDDKEKLKHLIRTLNTIKFNFDMEQLNGKIDEIIIVQATLDGVINPDDEVKKKIGKYS